MPVRIAVIADVQYADRDDSGRRLYRTAPVKLAEAIETLNDQKLAAVFHLGDFIDRDWASFDVLDAIVAELDPPLHHVLGNHDFDVEDARKLDVPGRLGLASRYYVHEIGDWRFIVLDGNDVSTYAWPQGSPQDAQSEQAHQTKYSDQPTWNGATGAGQLDWLRAELVRADADGAKVILLSHFPVFPEDKHNLWNATDVLDLIVAHESVKAWFNGHNHLGNYGLRDGVHFVTFQGMVDTEQNAFAVVELTEDQIAITGYGREPSRVLTVRASHQED